MFLCKSAGFEERDLALDVQVAFVTDEHDDNVGTGERPRIRQPL